MSLKRWPPRDKWDAMVAGGVDSCLMCRDLTDPYLGIPGYRNEHGVTIARLGRSILRLCTDQHTRGYCVLIGLDHGPEPHDLSRRKWRRYSRDQQIATAAIKAAVNFDKINVETLGNLIAHLHTHLTTRYLGDAAPGARLLRDHDHPVLLSPSQADELARAIRAGLPWWYRLRASWAMWRDRRQLRSVARS